MTPESVRSELSLEKMNQIDVIPNSFTDNHIRNFKPPVTDIRSVTDIRLPPLKISSQNCPSLCVPSLSKSF